MKYRGVYKVLEHRTLHSPSFVYTDRSGWNSRMPGYLQLANPLNIIAVDKALRYRFWITHSGRALSISYCKINHAEMNTGITLNIPCKTKKELAARLEALFSELDAEMQKNQEGV